MSVLKVIEVLANSDKSWEDAARNAVAHAAKSVNHIKSVFVDSQSAVVEGNLIKEFRVNVKITFEVN
jgi:flavin-binding protein dodecin